jgi:hypothetical protein
MGVGGVHLFGVVWCYYLIDWWAGLGWFFVLWQGVNICGRVVSGPGWRGAGCDVHGASGSDVRAVGGRLGGGGGGRSGDRFVRGV